MDLNGPICCVNPTMDLYRIHAFNCIPTPPSTSSPAPTSPPPPPSFSQFSSHSSPALTFDSPSPSLKSGHPGVLSLHNYRKFLSQDGDSPTLDNQDGKTLRRKNAASNLQTTQMTSSSYDHYHHHHHHYPQNHDQFCSVSSTTSSPPPPLSPSSSPSALSEQLSDFIDLLPPTPLQDVTHYGFIPADNQNPYKILDTFRDRLAKFPDPDPQDIPILGHTRARSDSILFKARRGRKPRPPPTTTVIHHGTSFDIINPHESLHFAQIVSFIEDVDSQSGKRDSYLSMSNDPIVIQYDHQDAATTTTTNNNTVWDVPTGENNEKVHDDLVGDSPHHPMPSISERLEEKDAESTCYSPSLRRLSRPLSRPLSMIRPWTAHDDLGEPGPPIYEDELPPTPSRNGVSLAMYDIGTPHQHLGMGFDHQPTTIIYSQAKPPSKKTIALRKKRNDSTAITTPESSSSVSGPLRRLRGIANTLRKKTFPRASLS